MPRGEHDGASWVKVGDFVWLAVKAAINFGRRVVAVVHRVKQGKSCHLFHD